MPDIDFQRIKLNLIPKKGDEPVIFYASQYETTRPFIADLFWGETEFAPGDDCWAEIDIRKNDDNLVVITDDVVIDNNEVSVILPVQAVTCIGKNLGQVKIYADDEQLIAALNFILEVQPDPLAGGVDSETAIDNLESQIAAIVPEVIGEDYYDKTEVDALLADKADASTTYTKTEVDNALALKANTADLATVATTGDYDDLINKPVIPAAQIQSDYAQVDNTQVDYIKNKPDIAGMIAAAIFNILPVGSASGNPCTFDTEISALLQALTAEITASGGGGTPLTPIPIVGHSEINLDVNGDTFTVAFGQTVYGGVLDVTRGKLTVTHELLPITYSNNMHTAYANIDYVRIAKTNANKGYGNYDYYGELANMAQCFKNAGNYDTADNVGKLFTGATADFYWLGVTKGTTLEEAKTLYNGIEMIYELATPIVIDVSSISPSAVVGTNTITSDCIGDVNVSYKDTIQHYIDERT